ncbi:hypothetical protein JCM6882_005119 [Rhodosporidiobolus microsporus]
MPDDDLLPPLPPPLPPSHARSFSSSSSSDAGSPRPAFKGWGATSGTMRRSDSSSSVNSLGSSRRGSGAGLARSGSRTLHGKSASSGSRASSSDSLASPTLARSPGLSRTLSASSSRSTGTPSRAMSRTNSGGGGTVPRSPSLSSTTSQRTRASHLLAKTSPSLSSHSRFASSPGGSLAAVGLRATPPVSPSLADDHGLRNFAKGLGQLPSPPHTASDAGSTAGSGRFNTVRSNGTDLTTATNSSGESPTKPQRPPKSEARRGSLQATTPPRVRVAQQQVPTIGRTSPTVAGSPAPLARPAAAEDDELESPLTSPRRRAPLQRDTFAEEKEEANGSAEFEASTTPTGENGLVGEPKRRLRARTGSNGASEVLGGGGEEAERRRERRSKNASLLEKNQKILDSINSQLSPSSSTSSLPALADESPPQRFSTIRRSSTSSTIREMVESQAQVPAHASPHERVADWQHENDRHRTSGSAALDRTLRSAASVDEFGAVQDEGSIRRSQTVGNIAAGDGRASAAARDSPLRSRTQGYRSSSRISRPFDEDNEDDLPPARAMTSMSNYPSTMDERRSPAFAGGVRRSDLVGSERTRAASAFGNTAERDRDFAAGMRRLASRELLRSAATGVGRERSQSEALPDPPTATQAQAQASHTPAGSLRNRPGLPREFLSGGGGSPSPSTRTPTRSSPRPDLDLDLDLSVRSPASPQFASASSPLSSRERFQSPRISSPLSTPDPTSSSRSSFSSSNNNTPRENRRQYSRSEGLDSVTGLPPHEGERPSLVRAKKTSSGSGGSGEKMTPGRRYAEPRERERRAESISEVGEERAYSRLSREGRANGYRSVENGSNGTLSPPPSTSSRYSDNAVDLQARKERLRSVEVGSEAWVAEVEEIRRRARSRQSGSSGGDARSSLDLGIAASRAERERDRTIRAINEVLAGQGIVATIAADPTSPTASSTTSSPRKRQSFAGFDGGSSRPRRISFADGTHQDSPSAPGSTLLSRTSSTGSRAGAESSLRGRINDASIGEHHKLLLSAFDRFDQHFSSGGQGDLPESRDLVKRMEALINSTTKLNLGLRDLVGAVKDEQVKAQLDEEQRAPTISISHFEKSINSLLRSSDDQVRNLTEDLIAFTRVERERDRLRRDDAFVSSRPVSRASAYASPSALHSPPKRSATSSPYEGASVSLASARSPTLPREVLRNPLIDPDDSASRRHTLSYAAGRSPFPSNNGSASPTPAGRRQSGHVRSPLADETSAFETPSRRQTSSSLSGGIGLGLPLPPRPMSTTTPRRSKGSDGSTVRASSPVHSSTIRFPTSAAPEAVTQIDSTPAISNSSPTRSARVVPPREYRTYSEADRQTLEAALEMGANLDERDAHDAYDAAPLSAREALSRSRSNSPEVELTSASVVTASGGGRRPKTRLSTGAIGSALKGVLRARRGTNEDPLPAEPVFVQAQAQAQGSASPRSSFDSAASSSPEERRTERRREVENILRRTASRN